MRLSGLAMASMGFLTTGLMDLPTEDMALLAMGSLVPLYTVLIYMEGTTTTSPTVQKSLHKKRIYFKNTLKGRLPLFKKNLKLEKGRCPNFNKAKSSVKCIRRVLCFIYIFQNLLC